MKKKIQNNAQEVTNTPQNTPISYTFCYIRTNLFISRFPNRKTSICCITVPTYNKQFNEVNISATYFNFCKKIASKFEKKLKTIEVSSIQIVYKIEVSFWQIIKKVEVSFPKNLQEILKYVAEQNNGHLKYLFF